MKDILLLTKFNDWYDRIKEPDKFLFAFCVFFIPFGIGMSNIGNLVSLLCLPTIYVVITRILRAIERDNKNK